TRKSRCVPVWMTTWRTWRSMLSWLYVHSTGRSSAMRRSRAGPPRPTHPHRPEPRALYRQERVGMHGGPFRTLKFRTMVVDAEQQLSSMLDASEGNGVLFKIRNDPRIT